MDKVTYELFVSMLFLKQSIEEVERILRQEEAKAVAETVQLLGRRSESQRTLTPKKLKA